MPTIKEQIDRIQQNQEENEQLKNELRNILYEHQDLISTGLENNLSATNSIDGYTIKMAPKNVKHNPFNSCNAYEIIMKNPLNHENLCVMSKPLLKKNQKASPLTTKYLISVVTFKKITNVLIIAKLSISLPKPLAFRKEPYWKNFITLSTLALSLFALTAHADSRDEALQKAKTDLNSQTQSSTKHVMTWNVSKATSIVQTTSLVILPIAMIPYKKLPDSQNADLNQDIKDQTDRLHNLGQEAFLNLQKHKIDYFKSKEVFDKENQKLNVIKHHLFNIEHNRY